LETQEGSKPFGLEDFVEFDDKINTSIKITNFIKTNGTVVNKAKDALEFQQSLISNIHCYNN
jgi:hypothetical protein